MKEDVIIVRLLKSVMCHLSSTYRKQCEPYGLTVIQYQVLMELMESGGELKVSDLAKRMQMSNSNLSAIIKRMQQHEFILRKRSEEDERIVMVSCHEKTLACIKDLQQQMQEVDVLQSLTKAEKENVIRSLMMLDEAIVGGRSNERTK